ncbi:hypothetical protein K2173_015536 [Erythroxylum novogranatense]|uniref:EF-hand domain-containing protein n=1 Tax=Erythroxylum novogranatense TaxID=1862640 RepID=A0AAV8ST43_9ROSI|nr:hypothetical protein K2173_015536 [Erythroxylum novogranatense]
MVSNNATEPLLPGSVDPNQKVSANVPHRRRFLRRVRSAPLAEFVPKDIAADGALKHSNSIFGELHSSFKKVAAFLAVYLGVGTVCFYFVRDDIKGKKTNGILDAMYFTVVTMTTVGYGDLVPDSFATKLLACLFVFTGMALVGFILSKAADYLIEKQETLLVKAFHLHEKIGPSEILKEVEKNKVKYKFTLVLGVIFVLMLVGAVFLAFVEDLDPMDSIYCVCSTITTLGYGDQSFSTTAGRSFAIFWILVSTIGLGQFFLYTAELFTENRQRALVNWVLSRKMTYRDLEAADIDNDGVVGPAEFVIYKLKEMGKISQEDISLVMEEFDELDVDQSGTISASDLSLAQTTEAKI